MDNETKLESVQKFIFNDEVQSILSKINNNVMDFNILEITGMGNQEIKHSNILGWLFDNSEHNLEYQILDNFLKKVIELNSNNDLQSYLYLSNKKRDITIYREKDNIDLLIVDESNKIVITIENKVYASERTDGEDGGQLQKYENIINDKYNEDYNKYFIFLTINLEEPTKNNWLRASHQMITNTIEDILKIKETTTKTKIVLESYVDLLKRNGIVADKKLEELCKQIWANKDYREAINILNEYQSDTSILLEKLRSKFANNDIYDFNKNSKTDFAVFTKNWKNIYPNYNNLTSENINIYFGFYIVRSNIMFWIRLKNNSDKQSEQYFNLIKEKLKRPRSQTRIDIYAQDLIKDFDIYSMDDIDRLISKFLERLDLVDECFK